MKCYVCNGRGYFPVSNIAAKICPQCDGTGEIEQTNEEWFCSLPTEEKADFLADLYPKSAGEALIKISNGDKERWERWLKQPHTEKE